MIKLNLFRNKYLVIVLSTLFLTFSCTTHGLETDIQSKTMNYDIFNDFKSNVGILNSLKHSINLEKENQTFVEFSQAILDQINLEMGTNLVYSDEELKIPDYSAEEIIEISLANDWMNQTDVDLINAFMNDLENHDFNFAFTNYENSILTLSVTDEKFEKLNLTANLILSANYENPEIFNQIQKSGEIGGWDCVLATLALAAATAGLSSCATVAACGMAVALHYNALKNFGKACLSEDRPQITNTQNN